MATVDRPPTAVAGPAPVAVDLRMRAGPDAPYVEADRVAVPADHTIGDRLFPYEGIGWENGFVGYRLYLDGRLTSDAFGKRQGQPALARIDASSSYHELADWGMDVLHVGPSLGMGGLGILRNGTPQQFGKIGEIRVAIADPGPSKGAFTIDARGIEGPGGATGAIASRYSIDRTSPLTRVAVSAQGGLPLVAGIVRNNGTEFWQSGERSDGSWQYLASFGRQSENKDMLGLALFYRADQARYGGLSNSTHFVAFEGPSFEYGFLAAWELDASRVKDRAAFDALLRRELARLNAEQRVSDQ